MSLFEARRKAGCAEAGQSERRGSLLVSNREHKTVQRVYTPACLLLSMLGGNAIGRGGGGEGHKSLHMGLGAGPM